RLGDQAAGMQYRPAIGDGGDVEDVDLTGFHVEVDLHEGSDERAGGAFARPVVVRRHDETLPREAGSGGAGHFIDVVGQLVAVEAAAAGDRALGGLGEREPGAGGRTAEDPLPGDLVILR